MSSTLSPMTLGALAVSVLVFVLFWGHEPIVPTANAFTIATMPAARPVSLVTEPAPPAPDLRFARGRDLLLQGNAAEAARVLGEVVAAAPDVALYRDYYAKALWQSGMREQALREYDAAVRLDPASVEYRSEHATACAELGLRDEAAREFARVLDAQPGDVPAMRSLARLKTDAGDVTGAVALLQRAVQARADPEVLQDLGYALEKSGSFDQAGSYYAQVLDRLPDAQITRSRLAETLLARNQPDEAARVLQEGIARTPTAPLLRRSLGSVLERTGKVQDAIAAYREYVRLAPNAEDAKALEARAAGLEHRLEADASGTRQARASDGS